MDLNEIERLYRRRQSCRAFSGAPVARDLIEKVCSAALLAPSACNAQPWKLIAALGEKAKEVAACTQGMGMNKFSSGAGAFVAVCAGKSNVSARAGARMTGTDFTANDLGILTAHLVLAAEAAGLASCILGWRNEKKLCAALGIPEKTAVPVVVALGYPADGYEIRPKKRKSLEETLLILGEPIP